MRALLLTCVLGSIALYAPESSAKNVVKVSFLQGKAEVSGENDSAPRPLAMGSAVGEGDTLATKEGSRLELSLADGSKLRLGANTKVTLTEAHFGEHRSVSVAMWVGRVWAKVAKAVGGEDTFEVGTRNAVAGVRGTSFAVAAAEDLSALVRVYTGTVGVRKGQGGENFGKPAHSKRQVPGPSRVDKKQWEEIIASAMKQIKITSAGDISPAEDFEDTGEELKWAMWNQQRDKVN